MAKVATIKEAFSSLLQCSICLDSVEEPKLCARCGSCFCRSCVEFWLRQHGTCPNCRGIMRPDGLGCGRLIEQLKAICRSEENCEDRCEEHGEKKTYFDEDEGDCVCAECAVLSASRRGHRFRKVGQISEQLQGEVEGELRNIQEILTDWSLTMRELSDDSDSKVAAHIASVKSFSEKTVYEMERAGYSARDFAEVVEKRIQLYGAEANDYADRVLSTIKRCTESKVHEAVGVIRKELKDLTGEIMAESRDCVSEMEQEINNQAMEKLFSYATKYVTVLLPTQATAQTRRSFVSESLSERGLDWKISVRYCGLDGPSNTTSKTCIGIFLMLEKAAFNVGDVEFEYNIHLLHPDGVRRLSYHGTATFRRGDSWGRNHFTSLQELLDLEFLRPSGSTAEAPLKICFSVRPSDLVERFRLQEAYIDYLHTKDRRK
eukprot:CAMPEP_0198732020 /NCGR_PEP_ID=MMETSP1475-20131203/33319_1 /TAXON_ID= ORGANISM="Unidentified sp., Strain CCMP1999" /NCGR_SAMPLE_ID=MMETSP1475 /ASSEMBLY_ACC=CAM_ASM_001111 /LENGTH=431 /DNA_ID=CAMNT_0044495053 /DNA_START=68 /DNA_END=1363 /DNA_ORIENTATION=-